MVSTWCATGGGARQLNPETGEGDSAESSEISEISVGAVFVVAILDVAILDVVSMLDDLASNALASDEAATG